MEPLFTAYLMISILIFLFFGMIWKTDTMLNAGLKTAMWGMVIFGVAVLFKSIS